VGSRFASACAFSQYDKRQSWHPSSERLREMERHCPAVGGIAAFHKPLGFELVDEPHGCGVRQAQSLGKTRIGAALVIGNDIKRRSRRIRLIRMGLELPVEEVRHLARRRVSGYYGSLPHF
jgi:hypothetical protein